jgi:hypothetical protein
MPGKDIAVGAVGGVPQQDQKLSIEGATLAGSLLRGAAVATKPAHLVTIEDFNGKTRILKYFIALDKPEILNGGFVQAKGIFCDCAEEEISKNFMTLLTSTAKELFLEVMFPGHKIHSIRNLAFRQK